MNKELQIKQCTVDELVEDANFVALRQEYAAESSLAGLPDPEEKLSMYHLIEASGALRLYGAYFESALVGFVAVLAPVLPHYGVTVAVTESLFVAAAQRKTGAGLKLIRMAEQHARDIGSPALLVSAPWKGRLHTLLPRLGYHETNCVFMKRLNYA